MKARLSLSAKIFLLALANLLLLVGALALLARSYYGIEPGNLLFAPARDRVVAVAREVAVDLEGTRPEDQTGLMGRFAANYGVDFYLFDNEGGQVAGRPVTLPPAVISALMRGTPPEGQGEDKGGRRPPPPHRRDGKRPPRFEFDGKGLPPEAGPPPEDNPGPPPPRAGGRFGEATIWNPGRVPMFQVAANNLHWAGIRMPIPAPGERRIRGTLMLAAPSFYGTPLFFDFKPWLGSLLAAMTIFALCWMPFIRGLTRSISGLTKATERIAEGDFALHLKDERGDELGQLAAAINRMTDRLAGFVSGQKRFLGDIAHELCAPLARIQFGLGILEQRTGEQHHGAVADVQDEVRQMSELVSELLSFSKAGMEAAKRPLTNVDMADAARRAVEREATGNADLRVEIAEGLTAQADQMMLVRAISNVVRNAIRYAGAAGPVTISAVSVAGTVSVFVRDCGPGLATEDVDQVFAPFYRPEASRNRSSGGAGLGLAIVKSCVEVCQGTVQCRNRTEGGLEVEIRLRAAICGDAP